MSRKPVQIDEQAHGRRVDNWLQARYKHVPRGLIHKLIRKGQVRINGKRASSKTRLQQGDWVRVPPVVDIPTAPKEPPDAAYLARLDGALLFEHPDFWVWQKPSGCPVHAGSGTAWGWVECLRHRYPHYPTLALVHRLDKETSGCLVVAKHAKAQALLQKAWPDVQKQYQALLSGPWQHPNHLCVRQPLKRVRRDFDHWVEVSPEGKNAATSFDVLSQRDDWVLVRASLHTGRTHQVRVHSQWLGCPIVGDRKYATPSKTAMIARGLFLHAECLVLPPVPGLLDQAVAVVCSWESEKKECIQRLGLTIV